MTDTRPLTREVIDFEIDGVSLNVAAMHREGERPPVVFLHGFGSTKEDYADAAFYPQFENRRLIAFDAPGCGETACADLSALSIPFLKRTAETVLRHFGVGRFHLVGHSMGGLTALMLAGDNRDSVLSFANIEGNVAPEDCFLSRQVLEYPADDPAEFLRAFGERAWNTASFSSPLYSAALHHKVRAEAVAPIFRSMVALSDNEDLMSRFTSLPCPKMFVYGEQNRSLSYLGTLVMRGAQLAEIEHSGHWPMYSNAPQLWTRLGAFFDQAEIEPWAE